MPSPEGMGIHIEPRVTHITTNMLHAADIYITMVTILLSKSHNRLSLLSIGLQIQLYYSIGEYS